MKKLLFLLLLLGSLYAGAQTINPHDIAVFSGQFFNAAGQSVGIGIKCTPTDTAGYIVFYGVSHNDTFTAAKLNAGGSGSGGFGSATLTGEAKIDADGNDILWQNTANYIIGYGNHAGQMGTFNSATADIGDAGSYNQSSDGTGGEFESYSDNVGGSFSHWLVTVGGNQAVLVDSGTQQGTYGYGSTNWVADNIAGTVTVNAEEIITQGVYVINDNSSNPINAFGSGIFQTQSSDAAIKTSIATTSDGSFSGIKMNNGNGESDMTLSVTGTTFNMTLPPYANDAAAGIGGLTAGDLYQITGTGVVTVKQ